MAVDSREAARAKHGREIVSAKLMGMEIRQVWLGHGLNKTLRCVEVVKTQWTHDRADLPRRAEWTLPIRPQLIITDQEVTSNSKLYDVCRQRGQKMRALPF